MKSLIFTAIISISTLPFGLKTLQVNENPLICETLNEQGDCKVSITGSCGSVSCWGSNCEAARACAWAKYYDLCYGA
jgi:hypothetical protein